MPTPVQAIQVRRTPRSVLLMCFLCLMLEGYDIVMYGTVVPSLLAYADWHVSPAQAGNIGSWTVAGMLVGALIAGVLGDRTGRRRVLIVSVFVFSLAMALCAVATSAGQFTVFRFIVGLGTGGLLPTVVALVVEYAPRARRGLNTAIAFCGVGVGGAVAGIFGTNLVPDHGFRVMFWIGAAPVVVVVPLLWRYLPESAAFLMSKGRRREAERIARRLDVALVDVAAVEEPSASTGNAVRALATPPYLLPMIVFSSAIFFCLLVLFGANSWLPTLMIKSGYGVTSSLSFLLVLNLGAVAGALVAAPIGDRIGSKPVVIAAFLMAAASISLLAVKPPVAVVYVLVALAGIGTTGLQILLNAYIAGYFPTELRATALGMALSIGRVGGIIGPMYGGHVLTRLGHGWQFHAYAVPALIGAIVVACVPGTRRRSGDVRRYGRNAGPAVGARRA